MRFPNFYPLNFYLLTCIFLTPVAADELDTITVPGTRENQQLEHLEESFFEPYTRDKLLSEDLKKEMVPDIKSALRDVPNISVTDSGAFSKRVEIRGLSGDRITYLVDDVAISNQGLTHAGGGEINLLDVGTVETIDIIKGSPSVIYAPGATGGIISVTTKDITTENHIGGTLDASYDSGYEMDKQSINVHAGYRGFGASINASQTDAHAYNIRDQAKLDQIILRTNVLDERLGTENEIKDLGYSSDSSALQLKYRINDQQSVSAQHTDYSAQDISFTHGSATGRVFHYDEFSRKANQLSYRLKLQNGGKISLNIYDQELVKDIRSGVTLNRTLLDSKGLNLKGRLVFKQSKLDMGAEVVSDEAKTNTFSEQSYFATYASYEYIHGDKFIYTAGARANRWEVEQKLKPGQNADVANDLVGISGRIAPQDEDAFTYAAGVIYSTNDHNNLSFNYSHTHRYPTLMERFAFDVFIGGGLDLEAEEADNIELGWKYQNQDWYASAALFYSYFDRYITSRQTRTLINQAALVNCINDGDCDPTTGDYDDRDSDFFNIKVRYINIEKVVNQGFEFSIKKIIDHQMEASFSFGLSEFSTHDDSFITDSRPLEFKGYYKKFFPTLPASPWIKLKARYVTDEPKVRQEEGFDPFLVADLYAGGAYKDLYFSAGIRNLFDKVYHEPYTALDGLERSFLVSFSYGFDKAFNKPAQ